jgi:hypothetical protein
MIGKHLGAFENPVIAAQGIGRVDPFPCGIKGGPDER